jgi:nitrilase
MAGNGEVGMGDETPKVRAAAVQAASVFLDREASVDKACALIREAGAHGAHIIAFPEGFIPAHPIWFHFHPGTGRVSTQLSVELFKNAVEIPGPQIARLQRAAAEAGAYVVVGVCEKRPGTTGTLYNSQVFLGPDGAFLGRRQKIMPTVGERLVHTGGQGDSLGVFQTDFGPASALICGENSNPLAVFAVTAQYSRVHVMSWPNHFPAFGRPMRDRVSVDSQAFAQMSKAFVVSACGTVDEATIARLELSAEDQEVMRDPGFCGGSVIVSPDSQIIAGPLGNEEAILYADLDLDIGIKMKLRHDFAGHYNRPDIFSLRINTSPPQIFGALDGGTPPQWQGQPSVLTAAQEQNRLEWTDPSVRAIEELTGEE